MEHDIFHEINILSHSEQENLLRKAYSICDRWWFDKLDCEESYTRQKVKNISFDEAMSHFVEGALMVVIQRRQMIIKEEKPYLEVGFRSMENPVDYFLWIIVPLKHANEITKGMAER